MDPLIIWISIAFCFSQSALFSGLTIGLFGLNRMRLEIESEKGNLKARRILSLRKDSNHLLTTLLWGNVSVNTLLTLLSDSVLAGFGAFFFSTIGITFLGEIFPQAYFSRHALRVGATLYPMIKLYQFLLYPIAKPTAKLLDWWLGKEGISYFQERDFKIMLQKHIEAHDSDISQLEGVGALNFLSIDDLLIRQEGERIHPQSIITLPTHENLPIFPEIQRVFSDPFLQQIQISHKKWIIITDANSDPKLVVDADSFLRNALYEVKPFYPYIYCHRPLVVRDSQMLLGNVLRQLRVHPEHAEDDVIDHDVILFWTDQEKRIITGADILGRLLRGIVNPSGLSSFSHLLKSKHF